MRRVGSRRRVITLVRQPWLPDKWDREADLVVVGFGGAGAATGITAHDLGATVLMLEKAPEGIEFPELPGSDCVHQIHHGDILGYSNTWKLSERAVKARSIDILYEAPGRELIQHGATKEILGIRAGQRGKPVYVKVRNAVAESPWDE